MLLYNTNVQTYYPENAQDFKNACQKIKAGGGTDFVNVFNRIDQELQMRSDYSEVTTIFMTDGYDRQLYEA